MPVCSEIVDREAAALQGSRYQVTSSGGNPAGFVRT